MLSGTSRIINLLSTAFCCKSRRHPKQASMPAPESHLTNHSQIKVAAGKNGPNSNKFDKRLFWRQRTVLASRPKPSRLQSSSSTLPKSLQGPTLKPFLAVMLGANTAKASCLGKPFLFSTPSGFYTLTVHYFERSCRRVTRVLQNTACNTYRIYGIFLQMLQSENIVMKQMIATTSNLFFRT